MRAIKQTLLLLILIAGISVMTMGSPFQSKGFDIKKTLISPGDTSLVNRYTRLALKMAEKKADLNYIKANIDTAELICKKENIEIPALLHLARAKYFFLKQDFNNSSQEAMIALTLSERDGDPAVIEKTMLFLGNYNLRTGFFKESIYYFNNSIDFAKKERLKGYIPWGYRGLSDVYHTMGNTREYNKSLENLIAASHAENDSSFLKAGYYLLGTSYTGENRNYRKHDSLDYQDYKVPDSLLFRDFNKADSVLRISLKISMKTKDSTFIILSLANLGWNFYREKKFDSAIKEYNKALTYSIPSKMHESTANAYGNLGTTYRDMGMTELSLKYYTKSIEEAKKDNDIYNLYWVYLDMSDMYLLKRDT